MSSGKNRVCLRPCLCVTHEDIKVRQALCPSYAAVAPGSVPLHLLQGRSCYLVSSGASFFPGWACRWLPISLDIFNEYLFFKEVNRLFFSKSHSYPNVDWSEQLFSKLFEQYSHRTLHLPKSCCTFKTKWGHSWTKQLLKILTSQDPSLIIQTSSLEEPYMTSSSSISSTSQFFQSVQVSQPSDLHLLGLVTNPNFSNKLLTPIRSSRLNSYQFSLFFPVLPSIFYFIFLCIIVKVQ